MGNRSEATRERHLEGLATAFFEHLEYGEEGSLGLDEKRPFGWSGMFGNQVAICEIIGIKPKGPSGEFTGEQCGYAQDLFEDLRQFLITKWRVYLELKGQHDSIS